jgi:hypothetical protein
MARTIIGVDFTSAPRRAKPITVALGQVQNDQFTLESIERLDSLEAFQKLLSRPGPWLGGFDVPFGLPREFIRAQRWRGNWTAITRKVSALTRDELRARCKAFCDARPAGKKFAHRATDGPAGSSPSMKWVNPPVVIMLHAATPLLLGSGVHLPGLRQGDPSRVVLEAYPGFLARQITSESYKSDSRAKQTEARRDARLRIFAALTGMENPLRIRAKVPKHLGLEIVDDGSGDCLDALICALQAARAGEQPNFGMPADVDPLEGWIATVPRI